MISCKQLSKTYGNLVVLESFTHTFSDHGFYLLFGESGSGKTTLLNVLSGMISYDAGEIIVGNQSFESRVDPNCFPGGIDYVTQDPFFVEFLSVRENLEILLDDKEEIEIALRKFGLLEQINLPTTVLSGGERQRLALARSFLRKKKVIFLDEPTAALDEENKKIVFDLISMVSKTCLVICSSHDVVAKDYADEIVLFEKHCVRRRENEEAVSETRKHKALEKYELISANDPRRLPEYMKKWFSSKQRGRKNNLFLGAFLVLAMMLCLLADTPQAKMDSNIEHVYKINSLLLETWSDDAEYFASLVGKYGITDVVLLYNGGVPASGEMDYEPVLYTIPFEADSFRLSDKIEAGTYFQEKNDIILSSEMANALRPDGDWSSLVGMTIPIKVYKKGIVEFRVSGILGAMNDFERQYLSSASTRMSAGDGYNPNNYVRLFYINSLFTDDYMFDKSFYRGEGQRSYQIYFDSYKSAKKYMEIHDEKYGTVQVGRISNQLDEAFLLMACILLPLSGLIMLLSLLFYGNLIRTELTYNDRFISAFNYVGYDIQDIIRCFVRLNTKRLAVISLKAMAITMLITTLINYINKKAVIIGFQLFTYNPIIIVLFIVLLILFSMVSVKLNLRRVKAKTWYENIIASRDLL